MCTGAELAVLAATTAAKQGLQTKAQSEVNKAKTNAQNQYYDALTARRRKAASEFRNSLATASNAATDTALTDAAQERQGTYKTGASQTQSMLPGQGDSSKAVQTAIVQSKDKTAADIDEAARRSAILGAYGDVDLAKNIGLIQNANRIGLQGKLAEGENTLLNARLADAASAGDKYNTMGDIIGAMGTLALASPNFTFGGTPSELTSITNAQGLTETVPIPGTKPYRLNNPISIWGVPG